MMLKKNDPTTSYLRKIAVLPVVIVSFLLFAFTYNKAESQALTNKSFVTKPDKPAETIKRDTSKPNSKETFRTVPDKLLVVIDNERKVVITEKRSDSLEKMINPSMIRSMNILKGDEAEKKYGKEWRTGVIEIETKGKDDSMHWKTKADIDTIPYVTKEDNLVFEKVETEATFPGGEVKWNAYLANSLDQTIPKNNGAPKGQYTVILQFVVNTEGYIKDVKALTNFGYGMEEEAMRLVKKGPRWIPAVQNGRQVVAYRKVAITFSI